LTRTRQQAELLVGLEQDRLAAVTERLTGRGPTPPTFASARGCGSHQAIRLPRVAEALVVKVWTVENLRTLYHVASPLLKGMILLGLNCASQEADVGDLEDGHLFLRSKPLIDNRITGHKPGDSWIVMTRKKTGTPGVHKLWPETIAALEWLKDRRDRIVAETGVAASKLFISEKGKCLTDRTSGGNKSYRVSNLWQCCLRAATKSDADLPTLPIKFLRKTSQDYMRPIVGDEVTSVHARRGKVSADTLMKFYASRPRAKVAAATDQLRERFDAVLGLAVADAG
jgi:hypothetical protein